METPYISIFSLIANLLDRGENYLLTAEEKKKIRSALISFSGFCVLRVPLTLKGLAHISDNNIEDSNLL